MPDKSAFCDEILPGPCYGAEETTFAKTNVLDCVFAKKTADIISLAYDDLALAELAVTDLLGPTAVVTSFAQPTPFVPAGVIAVIGTTAVVWLTGTTNFSQLALQAFYFGTGPLNQGLYSTSGIDETAALAIADQINAAGAGTAERIVLTGHSFGGAICMVLACKMLIANPGRDVSLLTLGAPKPGDQRLINRIVRLFQVHYANERDPIPYMPPRGLTFIALTPIIGPVLSLIWPTFARVPIVKTITEDGQFVDERTEDLPDDLMTIATIAIASGVDAPTFRAHLIDWYSYYLCKACPCVPRPCVAPPIPVLGFQMEVDALEFDQGAGPEVITTPMTVLTATAFYPDGDPSSWAINIPGVANLEIDGIKVTGFPYTSFRVNVSPDPIPPAWLCYWDFTAAEMAVGIDTSNPPTFIQDTFLSLGSLVVLPNMM